MTFMEALNVTIVSMIIVFVLLAALMAVIYLQSYLIKAIPKMFDKSNNKSADKNEDKTEFLNRTEDVEENFDEDMCSDDELQTVAAIMASLSEYMGVSEQKLVIKSIKRINSNDSKWANANLN
jgi:Na+-transporting methylmalonyl-CoA/oxaloacetate decarboxylase gamma subunit